MSLTDSFVALLSRCANLSLWVSTIRASIRVTMQNDLLMTHMGIHGYAADRIRNIIMSHVHCCHQPPIMLVQHGTSV
ncbi:hypothetical protein BGW36DRAFT_366670 [Talaromyces proteolyticus]|uniref:Uncharacterized protein n=1 Tax=Talaromyces proteolyticus TaxID=1131652 RepID=A0AAD4L324_9EURO|nr:uncharacterized protein BGW36DRAFT_366670 [Talaromyces proteolyticus]KAH8705022.1 hypothetical protein BGW36DRAFT_366670 [Talaromyces proteolyticus]